MQTTAYLQQPKDVQLIKGPHLIANPSVERRDFKPNEGPSKEDRDLEAQIHPALAVEHYATLRSRLLFLGAWFFLNMALTISNKVVFDKGHYPWLLTALQTSATALGCSSIMGFVSLTPLSRHENLHLIDFSLLFTMNIAISNVSLSEVSIPLHQIIRSVCPVVTLLIYRTLYGRTYTNATYLSMIPLALGIGLATAGDYDCTLSAFTLTLLGVILASAKTVATNRLMTGSLALSPTEVLLRMCPLAAIQCLAYAFITGEPRQFHSAYAEGQFSISFGMALLSNILIACCLNMVSFRANKLAGALTITVAGNVKQALTIALGIGLFNVHMGPMSAACMVITLAGAACYSKIELDNSRARARD